MDDFQKIFVYFEKCSLTFFEKQLISQVYPIIKRFIEQFANTRRCEWRRYDTSFSNTRMILNYKEKIDRIVRLLDSSDQKRKIFLNNFPTWKEQRKENIENLREIRESMEKARKACNIVTITASSVGLIGGAAIVGSILFPPAAPALLPAWLGGAAATALLPSIFLPAAPVVSSLAVGGGVAAAGGALGNVGATIAELVSTKKCLNKAKDIIARDRNLLKQLEVFEFFDELNDAIDQLFGKSISSKILDDMADFLKKVPPIFDRIQPIQKALQSILSLILPGITNFLVIGISLAAVVLSIFFVVFMIRHRGCVILSHRLALGLVSAVDASVEITRLIAAAGLKGTKLGELIPRQLAGKIAVGAIAGVGIALDVASIVVSSIDLAKGSLSDEISMISEVINKLECHLKSYQNVNDELKCVNKRLKVSEVTNWTTVVANNIHRNALQKDIKIAFNQYLPQEAWDCIKLEKLPTSGIHWLMVHQLKKTIFQSKKNVAIILMCALDKNYRQSIFN